MSHRKPSKAKSFLKHAIIFVIIIIFFEHILPENAIPLLALLYYGAYQGIKRLSHKKNLQIQHQIERLKDRIHSVDIQNNHLNQYLGEKNYALYTPLAKKVLTEITVIQTELRSLKSHIEPSTYQRVHYKAIELETTIATELQNLDYTPQQDMPDTTSQTINIHKIAPEISETYDNILKDHLDILDKIKDADNRAELEALHQSNMKRFEDILSGYLDIKLSPKNYYNAEERLEKAKLALEKFDADLDETIRQLNENNMKDFDVSLRMINRDL